MALYEVYSDGASRGQGQAPVGIGACAIVIYKNKKHIGQYARALGRVTNNQAEYEAVIMAITASWFAELDSPVIYSDSQLVVNQINDKWRCTDEKLYPLYLSAKEIQEVFSFKLLLVPRKEVHQADYLNNVLLDKLEERMKNLSPKTTGKQSVNE